MVNKELDSPHDGRQALAALDHRKLGQKLGLFALDPAIGKGLPLWLPNGTVIREELEKLAKELEFKAGFQRVATPHLARTESTRERPPPYFAPDISAAERCSRKARTASNR
jgi:threonyl-tRNA synthetase